VVTSFPSQLWSKLPSLLPFYTMYTLRYVMCVCFCIKEQQSCQDNCCWIYCYYSYSVNQTKVHIYNIIVLVQCIVHLDFFNNLSPFRACANNIHIMFLTFMTLLKSVGFTHSSSIHVCWYLLCLLTLIDLLSNNNKRAMLNYFLSCTYLVRYCCYKQGNLFQKVI
jgi:hypothetical protein